MQDTTDRGSFSRYWDAVTEVLGGANPRHKVTAIRGVAASTFAADGELNIRKLWNAMGGSRWINPVSDSSQNWAWRTKNMKEGLVSREVALERKIFDIGGHERWTYQMPTSSGLEGATAGRRRSIDLVHKSDPDHFALIELKCHADNPVYAAFEVLGYGLAYLHARRHASSLGTACPAILTARKIDLVVLGPRDWYRYTHRDGSSAPYQLDALEAAIGSGLGLLAVYGSSCPPEGMGFCFASYATNPEDTAAAAQEIVDLFG